MTCENHNKKDVIKRMIYVLKKIGMIVLLIYCGLGAVLFVFQRQYIYHPDTTDFFDCPDFAIAEKIEHGETRGYYTHRSSERLVVYYSGNAGRACDRAYLRPHLDAHGYSSLFVEYVGYGQDDHMPYMSGILDNVQDMINFIQMRQFQEVIVIGESIGVGPAAYHASTAQIDHLVLFAPYDNMASVAQWHYPLYPMGSLLRENFTPDIWLADYMGAVSLIVAQNDTIIPRSISEQLYAIIPSDMKEMMIVNDSGHNTMYTQHAFYDHLHAILR